MLSRLFGYQAGRRERGDGIQTCYWLLGCCCLSLTSFHEVCDAQTCPSQAQNLTKLRAGNCIDYTHCIKEIVHFTNSNYTSNIYSYLPAVQ